MEYDSVNIRGPEASKRAECLWPLAFIVLGLALGLLYGPIPYLLPYFIADHFDFYKILSFSTLLAPILYIIGIVGMMIKRRLGTGGKIKFSSIGGATLLAGAFFGVFRLAILFYRFSSPSTEFSLEPLDVFFYILPLLGVTASLLGAYFAMKRISFKGAMLAGAFSIFLGGIVFPLALVPIALDAKKFERKESKDKT
ncbi:MAG: hypothetical protein JET69_01475 [Methanomassiliicoccales archaeon]|nr:hypothetical protein [Methanomassiliicoccales archaeon]